MLTSGPGLDPPQPDDTFPRKRRTGARHALKRFRGNAGLGSRHLPKRFRGNAGASFHGLWAPMSTPPAGRGVGLTANERQRALLLRQLRQLVLTPVLTRQRLTSAAAPLASKSASQQPPRPQGANAPAARHPGSSATAGARATPSHPGRAPPNLQPHTAILPPPLPSTAGLSHEHRRTRDRAS
jgi:hypothetical protein